MVAFWMSTGSLKSLKTKLVLLDHFGNFTNDFEDFRPLCIWRRSTSSLLHKALPFFTLLRPLAAHSLLLSFLNSRPRYRKAAACQAMVADCMDHFSSAKVLLLLFDCCSLVHKPWFFYSILLPWKLSLEVRSRPVNSIETVAF